MLNIREITIEEFEEKIYDKYINLFPQGEQRDWHTIKEAYNNQIEKFYVILDEKTVIGFFMLEKINHYPYYLDYFAIYEEYQNKGYGVKSIQKLLSDIIKDEGLLGEVEEVNESDPITVRRWQFYERLGFRKTNYLFLFGKVPFNIIIYPGNSIIDEEILGDILMDHYIVNIGREETEKHCKILK